MAKTASQLQDLYQDHAKMSASFFLSQKEYGYTKYRFFFANNPCRTTHNFKTKFSIHSVFWTLFGQYIFKRLSLISFKHFFHIRLAARFF
jgi:hypothetical protein